MLPKTNGIKCVNLLQNFLEQTNPHYEIFYENQGLDHVTVNKPVLAIIYIVSGTCSLFSAHILVGGVNPQ